MQKIEDCCLVAAFVNNSEQMFDDNTNLIFIIVSFLCELDEKLTYVKQPMTWIEGQNTQKNCIAVKIRVHAREIRNHR